jgi:glucose/mannose-6-phosphate isomerase
MEQSILDFAKQFTYEPEIINKEKLRLNTSNVHNVQKKSFFSRAKNSNKTGYKNYILAGMGGSHLAGGILHTRKPGINLYIHRDYDLPAYDEEFCRNALFIASSYSGNTEEVLDFADQAYSKGYDILIISTGGKLIEFAQKNGLAYVQIPDTGIQPRLALGFSTIALAHIVAPELVPELNKMSDILKPEKLRTEGESIAETLLGEIPVIYTGTNKRALGYNWKIKMNETGKVPAFYNVFPELNHNEMQGYDLARENFVKSGSLGNGDFHFIMIHDAEQNPRITKRMDVVEELFQEKGYGVTKLFLEGQSEFEKIFNSLLLADWVALSLAKKYDVEPEQVPLIEEFKKRIA